ncbi:major facilitator superfamily domain-containing protein [Boeremia exigua]|uniref:major facilitator superfamily domain-containing protein n=1 Tax=Boeremia exigua TaxID=749465 RepID=UPI001E8E7C53|nr:major facilitator superfamily domain-containing protein [Boeremia exigua]KAH6642351.1 major facilitator superfamily domain-containing protein [Boeremia exigua]
MFSKAKQLDEAAATIAYETTPLLASVEPGPDAEVLSSQTTSTDGADADDEDAPLPKLQIFLLCYTRVIEPIAFFSIFPYINSMIEHVGGIKKENVGFYSGLIESLFSLTQMCVMIFWGRASDRYGRKPVLVFSLLGIAIATALFGMSQSIAQMIVTRCFAGVFAGTVVTLRAMFSENSTKHTQAKAFAYFAFAGNLGILIGPLLGGVFERPAEKYPRVFGYNFFRHYPYILPGLVVSGFTLSAALTTVLFVNETLHVHKKMKSTEAPMTMRQIVQFPGVARVILIFEYISVLAFTFTAVNPVFLYTPVRLGGMEFSPELIAAVIGFSGASQAAWLLLVFPALHKRIGTGQILRLAAWTWPFFFAINPISNTLLRHDQRTAFWAIAPPALAMGSGVAMAFTAIQLAINDISPSHETFGTLNAITLALSSGSRAVAPALATSVYAIGVKYHILDGHLFWLLNILLAFGLVGLLRLLPEKVEGRPKKSTSQIE